MPYGENEPRFERLDTDEVNDIQDALDSSSSFQELLDELRHYSNGMPEQKVALGNEEYNLADIVKAYETMETYVHDNRAMLEEEPDKIVSYLDGNMAATGILSENEELKNKAIELARKQLGLPSQEYSM